MNNSRVAYYHTLYRSAMIFNFLAGVGFIVGFASFYRMIGGGELPSHPVVPMLLTLLGFAIAIFGLVYNRAGQRYEYIDGDFLMALSAFAKIAFTFIVVGYVYTADIPVGVLWVVAIDFLYGLLFAESLIYKKKNASQFNAQPA